MKLRLQKIDRWWKRFKLVKSLKIYAKVEIAWDLESFFLCFPRDDVDVKWWEGLGWIWICCCWIWIRLHFIFFFFFFFFYKLEKNFCYLSWVCFFSIFLSKRFRKFVKKISKMCLQKDFENFQLIEKIPTYRKHDYRDP